MIMANNWKNGIILKWHHFIKRVKHFLKWKIFKSVHYDETFGVSGRLLVICKTKQMTILRQFFNQNELLPLKQELERVDYCLMPGTDAKPFNLTVFVYEMLYGTDYI